MDIHDGDIEGIISQREMRRRGITSWKGGATSSTTGQLGQLDKEKTALPEPQLTVVVLLIKFTGIAARQQS